MTPKQIKIALLKEMLVECNKTENEEGRLLVERFLKKIKWITLKKKIRSLLWNFYSRQ